jgi:hypothetical protein
MSFPAGGKDEHSGENNLPPDARMVFNLSGERRVGDAICSAENCAPGVELSRN